VRASRLRNFESLDDLVSSRADDMHNRCRTAWRSGSAEFA
jgi:hypothetical protein